MKKSILNSPAEHLVDFMTRIYDLQLTTPSGGNISMIDNEGIIWITPSQLDKGSLNSECIVRIFPDGTMEGQCKPSMEYRFHQEIYRARPDIRAVTHAHPPGLVAFSIVENRNGFDQIPSLLPFDPPPGFSEYALPGSSLLGEKISAAFKGGSHSVFMENHGIVTTGKTLPEAFYRLEKMETLAQIYIDSLRSANIHPVSPADADHARNYITGLTPDPGKHRIGAYEFKIRGDLVEIMKRSYERKLITAISGGFSAFVEDGGFVTTPEGIDVCDLDPEDLVFVSDGKHEPGKIPSQFTILHQEIYRRHNFIRSVASAHPIGVMAFAVTGTILDTHTIPESWLMLNDIPMVQLHDRFEHPERVAALLDSKVSALLITNDCITVTGNSPFQVFDRLEVAEFTARSILNAGSLGPVRFMSDQDISDLKRSF